MNLDDRIKDAQALLASECYKEARSMFNAMTLEGANRYEVWWGLIIAETEGFRRRRIGQDHFMRLEEYIRLVYRIAGQDVQPSIKAQWEPYSAEVRAFHDECRRQIETIESARKAETLEIQRSIGVLRRSLEDKRDDLPQKANGEKTDASAPSTMQIIKHLFSYLAVIIITFLILFFLMQHTFSALLHLEAPKPRNIALGISGALTALLCLSVLKRAIKDFKTRAKRNREAENVASQHRQVSDIEAEIEALEQQMSDLQASYDKKEKAARLALSSGIE